MQLPGARFSLSSKNIKTYPENISYIFQNKKFIFWDIELSSSKIKNFLYFCQKFFFLIIREMELFKKTRYVLGGIFLSSEKIYNILGNWTFWPQA